MVDLSRVTIEQLAESKDEDCIVFFILISFNKRCNDQVGGCGYVPSLFVFIPLPAIVKSISAVILLNAVDLYLFL
jgi:hypothetical protein